MNPSPPASGGSSATEVETRAWYQEYYEKQGLDRNDLLSNPQVLFQSLAFDVANTRALGRLSIPRATTRILDVGCGSGTSLLGFMKLGFSAVNMAGVDINSDRIAAARVAMPAVDFRCEGAESMSFDDGFFDLASESTMFVQITDDLIATPIAQEILRVVRPGGFIVLTDWRYSKPGNENYSGLSKNRIRRLFSVGRRSELVCTTRGALIPPIGRLLSQYAPWSYFLVQSALPFLVGQTTTVLVKRS